MHFSLNKLRNRNNNHNQSTDFFNKQKFKKIVKPAWMEKREWIKLMILKND